MAVTTPVTLRLEIVDVAPFTTIPLNVPIPDIASIVTVLLAASEALKFKVWKKVLPSVSPTLNTLE